MTGQTDGAGIDFTSSLYLDLHHRPQDLPRWTSLTMGVPAALRIAPASASVARLVAHEHGVGAGLVARSTLHAVMDVLGTVPHPGDRILVDRASYPISRWATLLPRFRGIPVSDFPHHRPELANTTGGERIWFVTDGWCPGCNRPAPIPTLQQIASSTGGGVVVDDSLGYGILGRRRVGDAFGDGSGTVHWCGTDHTSTIWVASFAKAYGTPLAVITGDASTLETVAREGGNHMHSSPPSAADVAAAASALREPSRGRRRSRLLHNTLVLRRAYRDVGLTPIGLPFPVVTIVVPDRAQALRWWIELARTGMHTLLLRSRCGHGTLLSAVVRSKHTEAALHRLAEVLGTLNEREFAA
ncbi:aminotransferase class I/II-fold pyridoxal phosphate-dependent enzyme [Rhodococcus sp. NPDC047139]|uniref:aminotransferase class I/II-fold pyridoxal phosphate-dependent enzyme n=1 Tax=Rhodococcus sp. NPDC047139 TaxID=3155141 RepID=UPI0033CE2630